MPSDFSVVAVMAAICHNELPQRQTDTNRRILLELSCSVLQDKLCKVYSKEEENGLELRLHTNDDDS